MKMIRTVTASMVLSALLLSGCGGGGGGAPAVIVAPPPTPAGIPVSFQAAGTTVTYSPSHISARVSSGVVTFSSGASASSYTISVTTKPNGDLSSVTFDIPTPPESFKQTYNSGFGPLNSLTLAQLAKALAAIDYGVPGSNGFLASQVAASQQLSSSAYGMWAILDTTSAGRIGAFAIGDRTPVASVPTTGTATYTGTMIGAGSGTAAQVAVLGNAQIVANFATKSVTTNFTNILTENLVTGARVALPNLTGTSVISAAGTGYSGPISGTGLTGTVGGSFRGPDALETSGYWSAGGGGSSYLGSYGAKK